MFSCAKVLNTWSFRLSFSWYYISVSISISISISNSSSISIPMSTSMSASIFISLYVYVCLLSMSMPRDRDRYKEIASNFSKLIWSNTCSWLCYFREVQDKVISEKWALSAFWRKCQFGIFILKTPPPLPIKYRLYDSEVFSEKVLLSWQKKTASYYSPWCVFKDNGR